jgi:hypothetical protein
VTATVGDPRFPGQHFTVPVAGIWRMTGTLPVGKSRAEEAFWRPRRRRRVVDVYLPGDWPETTETAITFDTFEEEETDP